MPSTWNSDISLALCLAAIASTDVRPNWDTVAQQLLPYGQFSASACSQKFYKLKKESEALLASAGNGNVPATPTAKKGGRQAKTPNAATNSAAGKNKRGRPDPAANDGDSEEEKTPVKKRQTKKEPKQAIAIPDDETEATTGVKEDVKSEDDGGVDGGDAEVDLVDGDDELVA